MTPDCDRCPWAKSELEINYHDEQWGRPERRDDQLFELLILEGFQAGLSWASILKKRENMRVALDGFSPTHFVSYDDHKRAQLLSNSSIIRNRAKIFALNSNAAAFMAVQEEVGSFASYLWNFVGGSPVVNYWERLEDIPTETEISRIMGRDMKKRGFKFVGPVICYAYMQAAGLVNDHLVSCHQHRICADMT